MVKGAMPVLRHRLFGNGRVRNDRVVATHGDAHSPVNPAG